jgi:hypothetical protein
MAVAKAIGQVVGSAIVFGGGTLVMLVFIITVGGK